MTVAATLDRAFGRLRSKGMMNTALYSSYVVWERILSSALDLKYGGKICASDLMINADHPHYHDMVHSGYQILDDIFGRVAIGPDDVLVDVGCGEGRVINFWLSKGIENQIVGLEANRAIAEDARRRYAKYPNVDILCGNAIDRIPCDGSIFFLYNPFSPETMDRFEAALRGRPATLVYYIDNYTEPFARPEWSIERIKPQHRIFDYRASIIRGRAG